MAWRISSRPVRHMIFFSSISQKENKSIQLTTALYLPPIVLRMTTKHNLIPFYVWSPDWKMLQNCICRTGHSSTESPFASLFATPPESSLTFHLLMHFTAIPSP